MSMHLINYGRAVSYVLVGAVLLLFPFISFSQSWVADSQYTNQPALATVNASSAYLRNITGQGITIGIIDSGINPNNLAFSGAIVGGYNSATGLSGVSNLADLNPSTIYYHGSFVASEIAARRGNGGYFQGIAYNSSIVVGAVPFGTATDAQQAAAINYVSGQGVRVINNSWGYGAGTSYAAVAYYNPLTLAALVSAVSNGAVIVFSSGNDGLSNPGLPGSLPNYNSAVAGSWITVAASTVDGNYMAYYSNLCGTSILYCITAPGGDFYNGGEIVGINGSSNSNTVSGITTMQGTSMAAPLVTGAVALVAQMFPWMSASQLTTSILTTGTNAVMPNTQKGRGLLQVDAAIQGPGIFESTFYANTAGYSSTFGNNISGSYGLIKSGAGTLTLSGANTYSGGTTLSGGTIAVGHNIALGTGSLAMSNATILQAAAAVSLSNAISIAGVSTIDTNSYALGLLGVVSGTGNLTKISAGTLTLSGANTYSGGTTVTSGVLSVAGSSPTGSGDVYVAPAGTLMGIGKILGYVVINGKIKVGLSPGYLEALSAVLLETGSTYQQDIAGTAQANSDMPVGASGYYSYLTSVGQFTIDSGATLTPQLSNLFSPSESGYGSSIYIPVLGDRFRIVTAGGGISGRFSTLTQPAELSSGTQFIAFYNVSNSIELAVTPTSYDTDLASSKTNAQFVATVLDQLLITNKANAATATQDQLLYSVAGQTAASLPAFAQSLSGEIHAASVATLPQTTQRLHQAVLARLGDYQMPPTNINPGVGSSVLGGSMSTTNLSGAPTANMSSNPEVNPNAGATSAATADGRAWGEIAYQRAQRSGDGNANSFNSNLYQAVFGVDAYANAELGLKLGGGLALSNTTVSANSGSSTIQQGALFVYGKMPVLQDYVLDGMVSIGLSSTNLSRNDPTGLTGGFSKKSVMGNDAMVSAGISRPFTYSDVRITPYVRLTYQYVGQASYDEGSGAAALSISRFSGSAVRGTIGVAAGSLKKDPLKDGYTYRANIGVGADTTGLLNPIVNTTLGGFASSVTTPNAGAAFVQVGLYGTVKIADNAYAYAGVSAEARTGQTIYGGSVGLRMAF